MVPGVGLEPTRPVRPADFKSAAYTVSPPRQVLQPAPVALARPPPAGKYTVSPPRQVLQPAPVALARPPPAGKYTVSPPRRLPIFSLSQPCCKAVDHLLLLRGPQRPNDDSSASSRRQPLLARHPKALLSMPQLFPYDQCLRRRLFEPFARIWLVPKLRLLLKTTYSHSTAAQNQAKGL